jgi:uncharacterized protein
MVSFRDPIHGDLVFDGVIEELIRTEEFQRLSEVKQLGLTDKVYPGANHTRFAHSLGVCFLAGQMARRLGIPKDDCRLLQVAALLHDIGHYDFSHALEELAPCSHEENGMRIICGTQRLPLHASQIPDVLRKYSIDAQSVVDLLQKKGSFPQAYYSILSSTVIDADRMDYLKRDTYFTGAVIGEIDIARLLSVLVLQPVTQRLGIKEKGIASLEQFLIARLHMYRQVYLHRDSAAGEVMLRRAVQDSWSIASPLLYGDGHLLARLAEQGTPLTRALVQRLRAGRKAYYEVALRIEQSDPLAQYVARIAAAVHATPGDFEQSLCVEAGVTPGELLLVMPSPKRPQELTFPVLMNDNTWRDLFELSAVAAAAMREQVSSTVFVVYTLSEHAAKVRAAALALLGG